MVETGLEKKFQRPKKDPKKSQKRRAILSKSLCCYQECHKRREGDLNVSVILLTCDAEQNPLHPEAAGAHLLTGVQVPGATVQDGPFAVVILTVLLLFGCRVGGFGVLAILRERWRGDLKKYLTSGFSFQNLINVGTRSRHAFDLASRRFLSPETRKRASGPERNPDNPVESIRKSYESFSFNLSNRSFLSSPSILLAIQLQRGGALAPSISVVVQGTPLTRALNIETTRIRTHS